MDEHETPGQRARRLLEGTTPGPWRCDQYDVIPARTVSEGWLIADCGTSDSPDAADANARLIAAAPDLARDLIASEERVAALQAQAADLQAAIERVRPVVEALASRHEVGFAWWQILGRVDTSTEADAAWLRSLLPTAPESVPVLAPSQPAPAPDGRFTVDSAWRFE